MTRRAKRNLVKRRRLFQKAHTPYQPPEPISKELALVGLRAFVAAIEQCPNLELKIKD